ncbi:MAG: SDR family NAD(P)-dependent oxidoreductase [Spirochaetales bacterium]
MATDGRTILITGATSGIGFAGALELGRRGWRVLVHGRSPDKAGLAVARLQAEVPSGSFEAVAADLSSRAAVTSLASTVLALAPRLDVLWNNAGGQTSKRTLIDGAEWQMAVNHLAGFQLAHLLLPALEAAPRGRVLCTSSSIHSAAPRGITNWLDSPAGKGYPTVGMYGQSKLANILFVQEWSRRHPESKVTAHAFHPGYVKTNFGSGADALYHNAFLLAVAFGVTPAKGAQTAVYLAETEHELPSGGYWYRNQLKKPSRTTPELARQLWDQSAVCLHSPVDQSRI